jgi:hypothetical protein
MFGLQAFICPFQMAGNGFLSAEDVTEKQKVPVLMERAFS